MGHHRHALLLDARAEWLTGVHLRAVAQFADNIAKHRIRSRALAEAGRKGIDGIAAEAQALHREAADLRQFIALSPVAQLRAMEQEWGESAKSRQARQVAARAASPGT